MASDKSGDEAASRVRMLYRPALTRLVQARSAFRQLWKLENLDLAALLLLCLLTIGGLAWGWALRPPAGAPAQILTPLTLTINFTAPHRVYGLEVYSYLTQERGAAATLIINASGNARPGPRADKWILGIQGFSGHFCTPKKYQSWGRPLRVGSQDYVDNGTRAIPARSAVAPFLVVHLCWNEDPLLAVSNSYFSAALPLIQVPKAAGTLTDGLQLRGTSLSSYSPSGGPAPTGFGPQAWSWTTALSGNIGSQASSEMPVFGASTTQIERDNHNTFYSGILFGIAAGAALSLIPALAISIDRRKKGPAAPAGQNGSDGAVTAAGPATPGEAPS